MSEQSISDKSQIIRNETQQHANTRGRVADVIDDINETKANKTDVTDVEGDISAHLGDFNNPHQVTKSQVGLGNVDNTADIDKPISNAVQAELDDIRTDIEGQTDWNVAQDTRLDQLEQHNIEQDTALGNKANTDASNISPENSELWRKKLNVPQIPDSVISIGAVTADSSTVYLALPLTGKNAVLIDGQTYERTDPQSFPFTPVTTGEKILIIHALPDAQVFHLAQGTESTEAVEPAYSGLFVARLLVTDEGIDIVEAVSGFREKAVDNFAIYSLAAGDRVIGIDANMRLKVQSSGAVRIGGFVNEEDKLYNGCPISVRNDTPFPMEFYNAVDASPEFVAINSADLPFSIKPGETANFAYRGGGIVEIIKTGGSASFPEGTNGQVLELDSTAPDGVKWVDKIKGVASGFLHYWDGSTWLSSGVKFISAGILKVKSIILTTNSGTALPDELGYDGTNVFFGKTKRKLRYNDSTVFTYTPTGNFTISQIRTAMETAGYVFNDCHINVQLGSNNYTCTIDIGVSHPYRIFTMDRNGTGSISFLSTRTLNSGVDSITILNGNENSTCRIKTGTSVDFLKIRNE